MPPKDLCIPKTIDIQIPAPPEGWVYDGLRPVLPKERYLANGVWVESKNLYPSLDKYPVAVKATTPDTPALEGYLLYPLLPDDSGILRTFAPAFENYPLSMLVENINFAGFVYEEEPDRLHTEPILYWNSTAEYLASTCRHANDNPDTTPVRPKWAAFRKD